MNKQKFILGITVSIRIRNTPVI